MKTITEVRSNFWGMLKETNPTLAEQKRTRKRQNDYCTDIKCTFVDYVDNLQRDGQISTKLANRATL
jgi:hypothetical protein